MKERQQKERNQHQVGYMRTGLQRGGAVVGEGRESLDIQFHYGNADRHDGENCNKRIEYLLKST
jgi:hypothetical protein